MFVMAVYTQFRTRGRATHGAYAGAAAAFRLEYWQGLDGGIMNLGDVRLFEIAAKVGADLRVGRIKTADVGSLIRDTLCQY